MLDGDRWNGNDINYYKVSVAMASQLYDTGITVIGQSLFNQKYKILPQDVIERCHRWQPSGRHNFLQFNFSNVQFEQSLLRID